MVGNPLLGQDFMLSTIALILSILDWLATTILLPQMLFSNFDFLQQNFAVISKTFLDNSDSATVSVLSHSRPARTLFWNRSVFKQADRVETYFEFSFLCFEFSILIGWCHACDWFICFFSSAGQGCAGDSSQNVSQSVPDTYVTSSNILKRLIFKKI